MMQVGARNMQNFSLLRKLALVSKPVLLKRGPSATVKEWLLAAEYLLAGGNTNVVLCERGIKTFETATRNTLDLAAVALVKHQPDAQVQKLVSTWAARFDTARATAMGFQADSDFANEATVAPAPTHASSRSPVRRASHARLASR